MLGYNVKFVFIILTALLNVRCIAQAAPSVIQNSESRRTEYRKFAVEHSGDAPRGKLVFANEQKTACATCHTTDGTGGRVGPDLSSIGGKFPREELTKALLEPSSTIAIGYGTTVVEKKSGEEIQGVIKQATDNWIELMQADGKLVRIEAKDIERQKTGALSLMPEGIEAGLSHEEFADLIAYLESLKGSGAAMAGMPDPIPRAVKAATFQPLFRENTRFDHPVWLSQFPSQTNRYVVLEHFGTSWIVEQGDSADKKSILVDLKGRVRVGGATGLLGFALHPKFPQNRNYYLKYQIIENDRISTIIDERQFAPDLKSDSGSPARQLLKIPAFTQDHNGGCIAFGPDGFLYIGMGDSGPQQDPQGHGQDLNLLVGKILRIDVDQTEKDWSYAIPTDNPFRTAANTRPEIWAYGFREPWRFNFDPATGDLWVGDVGQDTFEEVGIVRAGENHGWNVYEGVNPFSEKFRRNNATYIPPVLSYPHRRGVSVTGGYVYRGRRAPKLEGWYIFGDFERRQVWAVTQTNRTLSAAVEIGVAPSRIVSFAQTSDNELCLVGYDDGRIHKLDLSSVDPTPVQTRVLVDTAESKPIEWRFTLAPPPATWMKSDFDDSHWTKAPAGFGTQGTPGGTVRTEWRSNDIWLRRTFALEKSAGTALQLRLHHDEDADVFLNGVEAAKVPGYTTGYIDVAINPEAVHSLHSGTNVIAIHCRQTSGGQYIDAGIVEEVAPH
jgi:putative heme-binding domain-containing protein